MWGALTLVAEMVARGQRGSVVSLICDGGARYARTYYQDSWVAERGWQLEPYGRALDDFLRTGRLDPPG
jgi:cysteine synthase A